jgi:autotransporter passenger strand-loop-strand repeat protein
MTTFTAPPNQNDLGLRSGDILNVNSGGEASLTGVNAGAIVNVNVGGATDESIIDGGVENVRGTDSNSVLSLFGVENVLSGGSTRSLDFDGGTLTLVDPTGLNSAAWLDTSRLVRIDFKNMIVSDAHMAVGVANGGVLFVHISGQEYVYEFQIDAELVDVEVQLASDGNGGTWLIFGGPQSILSSPGPSFSPETAGTIVYTAEFGSAPSATELNVLNQFTQAQFAYGQQIGVQDPSIYAFQALGVALASTATNFQNTFGPAVDGDVQFVVDAYASVFGQAGSGAQIQQFVDQLNSFEALYTAAGVFGSQSNIDLLARGAVYGQMLGIEQESNPGGTPVGTEPGGTTFTAPPDQNGLVLNNGDILNVNSGGVAKHTELNNGGIVNVNAGGATNGTFIDGVENVAGTDTGSVLARGGVENVLAGGSTNGLDFEGGTLTLVDPNGLSSRGDLTWQDVRTPVHIDFKNMMVSSATFSFVPTDGFLTVYISGQQHNYEFFLPTEGSGGNFPVQLASDGNGGTLVSFVENTLSSPGPSFSPETAGTIVYTAEFGSAPDATELNILNQFTQAQFAYGQQIGVQDPSIYAFQALGVALASTATNFQNTFGPAVDGDVQFVVDAYAGVFGQAGSGAQIQQFADQLNYFEALYTAAGVFGSQSNIDLLARGAVYGQMLGIEQESTLIGSPTGGTTFTAPPNQDGLTLSNGDILNVNSNGRGIATTINAGGIENVNNGGQASSTQINAQGILNINNGGQALSTSMSGGILNVAAGGLSHFTLSGDNSTENVSGHSVLSDINLDSSIPNSSATQNVLPGGMTAGTIIEDDGSQHVSGTAFDTQINATGEDQPGGLEVVDGGTALSVFFFGGGSLLLNAPSDLEGAITARLGGSGTQNAMIVINEAVTSSSENHGLLTLNYGDHQSTTYLVEGASASVDSDAIQTTIMLHIDPQPQAPGTTIKAGDVENVSGQSGSSVIQDGGVQNVLNGAIAGNTQIGSGGHQFVNGGTTIQSIIDTGGVETIAPGGHAVDVDFYGAGTLELSDPSQLQGTITVGSKGTIDILNTAVTSFNFDGYFLTLNFGNHQSATYAVTTFNPSGSFVGGVSVSVNPAGQGTEVLLTTTETSIVGTAPSEVHSV